MKPHWDVLPGNVRHTVEQQIDQVPKADPVTKGLMPGLATRLHTEAGGTVFLSAISTSPAASLYERVSYCRPACPSPTCGGAER